MMNRSKAKPYIAINMAMSADGKISTFRRQSFPLGSRRDREFMSVLRAGVDAVVIGSRTLEVDGLPILVHNEKLRRKRIAEGLSPHPTNVVVSSSLDIPTARKFFTHPDTRKLIFTAKSATRKKIEKMKNLADIVVQPYSRVSPKRVVADLARRGIERILLEGGGEVNFAFLKTGLADEIYITVTPFLIGGAKAPTVVDGRGFLRNTRLKLKLLSARQFDDEIFLRYRILGKGNQ